MTLFDTAAKAEELSARAEAVFGERGERETRRRRIEFYASLIAVTLLIAATSVWSQQHIENLIGKPQAAVVHLLITSDTPNPMVCPGDVLQYTVTRDVSNFFVGHAVVVVKGVDSGRQEMSGGTDVIYDADQVRLNSNWQIPPMLPATLTKPQRPWYAGQFRREIAVVSYVGDYTIEPANIDFRIAKSCPGVVKQEAN